MKNSLVTTKSKETTKEVVKATKSSSLNLSKLNKILDKQLENVSNIRLIIRYTDGLKAWEFTEEQLKNRETMLSELFNLSNFIYSEILLSDKEELKLKVEKPVLIQSIKNFNPFTIEDIQISSILSLRSLLSTNIIIKNNTATNYNRTVA